MTRSAVVIGRGLAGLAAAFELMRLGIRVTLVGPEGEGASRAAQGVSSTKGLLEANSPFFRLKLDGHRLLPGWISEIEKAAGLPVARSLTGAWELFPDQRSWQKAALRIYRREFRGAFGAQRVLQPPFLDAAHAFFYPGELWFDPEGCCDALEKALLSSGVTILNASVLDLGPGWAKLSSGQSLSASLFILAAGAGSRDLIKKAGLADLPELVEAGGSCLRLSGVGVKQPSVIIGEKCSMYVDSKGLARLGSSTRVDLGQSAHLMDIRQDADLFLESVKSGSAGYSFAQLLKSCTVISQNWGVRVRTSDRFPLVLRHLYPTGDNLFISTGYWKNGLQIAHLSAKAIAWAVQTPDLVKPGENLLRLFAEELHRISS